MSDALAKAVLAEYGSLDPLQVRISTHREHSELADDVQAAALGQARLSPGHDVLDVGFGTGDFLRRLRDHEHAGRVVGVDTSTAAVAAVAGLPGITAILGSATALPLPDNGFDRVFARHMLYHVTDPAAALGEFRRVLRPGGLAVAVVNHPGVVPHVMSLVRAEVERHLAAPGVLAMIDVHSDNLPGLMRAEFGGVRVTRFDNHLVFDRPEPVIRFACSVTSMCGLPPDSPEYPDVVRDVSERVHAWFAAHDEPWRDPKGYAVCVAERA
jgi:SAM-dependent methyltransferase